MASPKAAAGLFACRRTARSRSRVRPSLWINLERSAALHTGASSTAGIRTSRPLSSRPVAVCALAAAGLGLAYLVYRDRRADNDHAAAGNQAGIATQNVRFQRRIPQSAAAKATDVSADPLSILDPAELASSTAHLVDLPLAQLMRAYVVFLASSSPFLVDIAPSTISNFQWLRDNLPFGLGRPLWSLLVFGMRQTFFAQFVAGETAEKSFPLLEKLHSRGCSAMLNWSAEADHAVVTPDHKDSLHQPDILKESFDELYKAVKAAIDFHPEYELRPTTVAIKMTGLVRDPAVFERFTKAIEEGHFDTLSLPREPKSTVALEPPRSLHNMEELSNSDVITILAIYSNLSSLLQLASSSGVRIAFDAEQSWYQPALNRIVTLLAQNFNRSNHQQGEMQPAIVYNTYQTNLKSTESVLRDDLRNAKKGGYSLGIKLVRGAYVTAENAHAAKKGVPSKVWPNKAATDACFDACSELLLQEVVESLPNLTSSSVAAPPSSWTSFWSARRRQAPAPGPSIIYATHNATSIKRSLEQMREKGLVTDHGRVLDVDPRIRGRISYAQLLGMTDNLTTAMFQLFPHTPAEPNQAPLLPITALYVPYGQIDRVLPYLVRRAQENKAILQGSDGSGRGGAAEQRRAIGTEIRRRFFPFL